VQKSKEIILDFGTALLYL